MSKDVHGRMHSYGRMTVTIDDPLADERGRSFWTEAVRIFRSHAAPIEARAALRAGIDPERVELTRHKGCAWLNVIGDVTDEEACEIAEAFDRIDDSWDALVIYASNKRHGFSRVDVESVDPENWCSMTWRGHASPPVIASEPPPGVISVGKQWLVPHLAPADALQAGDNPSKPPPGQAVQHAPGAPHGWVPVKSAPVYRIESKVWAKETIDDWGRVKVDTSEAL